MTLVFERATPPARLEVPFGSTDLLSLVGLAELNGWDRNRVFPCVSEEGYPCKQFDDASARAFAQGLQDGLADLAPGPNPELMQRCAAEVPATREGGAYRFGPDYKRRLGAILSSPEFVFQRLGGKQDLVAAIAEFAMGGEMTVTNRTVMVGPGSAT